MHNLVTLLTQCYKSTYFNKKKLFIRILKKKTITFFNAEIYYIDSQFQYSNNLIDHIGEGKSDNMNLLGKFSSAHVVIWQV